MQEAKEAWRASPNFGPGQGVPRSGPGGHSGLGPATGLGAGDGPDGRSVGHPDEPLTWGAVSHSERLGLHHLSGIRARPRLLSRGGTATGRADRRRAAQAEAGDRARPARASRGRQRSQRALLCPERPTEPPRRPVPRLADDFENTANPRRSPDRARADRACDRLGRRSPDEPQRRQHPRLGRGPRVADSSAGPGPGSRPRRGGDPDPATGHARRRNGPSAGPRRRALRAGRRNSGREPRLGPKSGPGRRRAAFGSGRRASDGSDAARASRERRGPAGSRTAATTAGGIAADPAG